MDLRSTFAANVVRLPAYEAGVNRSYVARIEAGRPYVGLEIIGRLEALEVEQRVAVDQVGGRVALKPDISGFDRAAEMVCC